MMISTILGFLVMLNPFALFIYLGTTMKELDHKSFLKVLFEASVISFAIFSVFLLSGNFLFQEVFRIDFESFRIFGGIVIFSFAYYFIVKGHKALIYMKDSLDDLAEEIAMPYMVGAGTISLTLLMSNNMDPLLGLVALVIILGLNYLFIFLLKSLKDGIEKRKFKVAFDKSMQFLLRVNSFFVGAIGIDMIITGVTNLFLS